MGRRIQKKRRLGRAVGAVFVVCILAGAGLAVVTQESPAGEERFSVEEVSWNLSSEELLPVYGEGFLAEVSRGGSYSRVPGDLTAVPENFTEGNPWLENMMRMALPGVRAANIPEEPSGDTVAEDLSVTEPSGPDSGNVPAVQPPDPEPSEPKTPQVAVVDSQVSKDPVVLIYHTHATESYQPYEDGNFHIVAEEGTVRDAGNILAAALEAKGIPVLHDKTLHDNPSYNQSYSRSLSTLDNLLAEYPSITTVIDLHRDAAAYSGNNARTFTAPDGTVAAQYSLVIGTGNDNMEQLVDFASKINSTAENMYPGFARSIIKKDYKFNQYKKDQYILLELGNNQNTIEQVRASASYFAEVMAAVLKGTQ